MRLRTLELSVGLLLLLGPLGYALTLEPEEVEVERVVEVERIEVVEVPAPAPAPAPDGQKVETPEPISVEPTPAPDLSGRLQFAAVSEAGLLLSSKARRVWGMGSLREHSGPGQFRAAMQANPAKLPEALLAHGARTFDVYGKDGKLCTARLGELSVLAQHDGPSLFEVFHGSIDGVEYEDGEEHPADVFERQTHTPKQIRSKVWASSDADRWLVAELVSDTPCEGALWARDAELPPPRLLHAGPSPIVEQRIAVHEASTALADAKAEYATWRDEHPEESKSMPTWAEIERDHPAKVTAWLDETGTPRLVELDFGYWPDLGCGDNPTTGLTAIDEVIDGAFEPMSHSMGFGAVFDVDLDGRYELLYGTSLESETSALSLIWDIYEVPYCNC